MPFHNTTKNTLYIVQPIIHPVLCLKAKVAMSSVTMQCNATECCRKWPAMPEETTTNPVLDSARLDILVLTIYGQLHLFLCLCFCSPSLSSLTSSTGSSDSTFCGTVWCMLQSCLESCFECVCVCRLGFCELVCYATNWI